MSGEVTLNGYIVSYEITDPGQTCSRRGSPDNWFPDLAPSWEVTEITCAETNEAVTYEQMCADLDLDERQLRDYIDKAIEEDIGDDVYDGPC
jgi:hypothetical protein